MLRYDTHLKSFSQSLRNNMTDAERLLWKHVRHKQICDIQFYRQKPIGHYIVDFYAPAKKIIIEIDGGQHFQDEGLRYDRKRDAYFASLGLTVLRFNNWQVLKSLSEVLEEIYRRVSEA